MLHALLQYYILHKLLLCFQILPLAFFIAFMLFVEPATRKNVDQKLKNFRSYLILSTPAPKQKPETDSVGYKAPYYWYITNSLTSQKRVESPLFQCQPFFNYLYLSLKTHKLTQQPSLSFSLTLAIYSLTLAFYSLKLPPTKE